MLSQNALSLGILTAIGNGSKNFDNSFVILYALVYNDSNRDATTINRKHKQFLKAITKLVGIKIARFFLKYSQSHQSVSHYREFILKRYQIWLLFQEITDKFKHLIAGTDFIQLINYSQILARMIQNWEHLLQFHSVAGYHQINNNIYSLKTTEIESTNVIKNVNENNNFKFLTLRSANVNLRRIIKSYGGSLVEMYKLPTNVRTYQVFVLARKKATIIAAT